MTDPVPRAHVFIPPRLVIVTSIYPPDIGGPATHARDLAEELRARGHEVTVVSLGDGSPAAEHPDVVRFPRAWPWPGRFLAVVAWLVAHRRSYDVVYATGLLPQAVLAARLSRRPVIAKVVGDAAWERGRRLGLVAENFDEFQLMRGGPWRVRAMRRARTATVRRATMVVAPSAYLATVVDGWLARPGTTTVVANGVRRAPQGDHRRLGPGDVLRAVSVGRLVSHKRVEVAVHAVAETPGVALEVVGDGPERGALEGLVARLGVAGRVHFAGAVGHDEVLARLAASHVLVSAASYEGLPHTVIEALACGVTVVASAAGGTTEAVVDAVNGLVVDPPSHTAFAAALARLHGDPALLETLASGARQTARAWSFEACADQIEALLARADRSRQSRPRAVFVGKTAVGSPPSAALQRKLGVLDRHLATTMVVVGRLGVRRVGGARIVAFPRLRPPLVGAAAYYVGAPVAGVALAAGRRPGAVVCQSPFEAFGCVLAARLVPRAVRPPVVVEVHGDWRTAARLYGGRGRRSLAPLADAVAAWSLRRADRVRAVGAFTEALARQAGYAGPLDVHVAFSDYDAFLGPPVLAPPARPQVAFVGVLEPYKSPDVLLEAWATVRHACPGARLVMAGDGRLRASLERRSFELDMADDVEFVGQLPPEAVARLLDASRCLALPSVSEGLPRIVLETMARGRPVVGTAVGGIPELVVEGQTGLLVAPGDAKALATALLKLLDDLALATDLGRRGRAWVEERDPRREFGEGTARLAAWITESCRGRR